MVWRGIEVLAAMGDAPASMRLRTVPWGAPRALSRPQSHGFCLLTIAHGIPYAFLSTFRPDAMQEKVHCIRTTDIIFTTTALPDVH